MCPGNQTLVGEFMLIGFPQNMQICILFFIVLFLIYIMTILGNSLLISAVFISPKLHTTMYFFLCNLSILDLCYSSISVPQILLVVLYKRRTISILGCMVQMNAGHFLRSTESLLLAAMAHDRYIAICFPLYYTVIMNWKMCQNIAAVVWLGGFFTSVVPNISKPLIFCTENRLDHFACEILALLKIACGNLDFITLRLFIVSLFILLAPFVFIVVSYVLIVSSILKIQSNDGRAKAFSTCGSHLIVVSMFYGTTITLYMGQTKHLFSKLKYISLIYGVLTPVLNPLIYSLRNNEVTKAFVKIFKHLHVLGQSIR
ncbi:PREDICTED: olfactory receptor 11-like [Nanorana parkeri]|uniref:olfactory receptor 11-like n=1 Tax=Nanorana parkeri TaxID=125878 RepID=UPI0008544CB6|nr:PREDICTED: olfactory receptor 11-like [Nanorana parkeri]